MTNFNKLLDKIPNTYKTFAWTTFYIMLSSGVESAINNLADLNLSPYYAMFAGLVLQGLSKYLATKTKK